MEEMPSRAAVCRGMFRGRLLGVDPEGRWSMNGGRAASVFAYLRRMSGAGAARAGDDAALLERFALQRDEAAFAELVRRHGPMVLGVCRRLLGNLDDAEDAFQATFL